MRKYLFASFLLFFAVKTIAQTISGKVTNPQNEPIGFAQIFLEQTYSGTYTNEEGNFQLIIPSSLGKTLKISAVGYKTTSMLLSDSLIDKPVYIKLEKNVIEIGEVIIKGTRANSNTPTAYTNVSKEELGKLNLGQDIPFLLNLTPSLVVSSDAGAGVGYTDMRIRGTDVTRINVTVNGIPLNDAESQGVFWVNMPDFSSSLNSVQIQRGVGTSTNGASAFGASVNLETATNSSEAFGETNISFGSFNTQKYNLQFGTGLLKNNWAFDGRLSQISSDGYVDRAQSKLRSYYLTGSYFGEKTTVKLVHFAGQEQTYQAWYGTPEPALNNNEAGKLEYALTEGLNAQQTQNLLTSDTRYNHYLYENEVDNYNQNHYQAHFTHQFSSKLSGNISFHYTKGSGYFEQFRDDDDFADYNLPYPVIGGDTLKTTNLIRRRWLDNDFYGTVFNLSFNTKNLNLQWGGAANTYSGDHFGEIIWSEVALNQEIRERYYDNIGTKDDASTYFKANYYLNNKLNLFGDIQYRFVNYKTNGIDADLRLININESFNFINPKAGLTYYLNNKNKAYFSVAVANREPSRSDYLDAALTPPVHETLIDYEFGLERLGKNYQSQINFFYMDYTNQLIATGELNDVGALVKTNVPNSFRAGVEVMLSYQLTDWLNWNANYTYSQNKIQNFDEVLYDYTNGFDIIINQYQNTSMALAPEHIAKSNLAFKPLKNAEINLISSYISDQFLDNTSNENRKINAFFINDLRLGYKWENLGFEFLEVSLLVNNIFNELYASRGYTYSYVFGEMITRNHYYPQATRNFLVAVKLRF